MKSLCKNLLIFLLVISFFQDYLCLYYVNFKYVDEAIWIYLLLVFFVLFFNELKKNSGKVYIKRKENLLFLLGLFISIGLIGNIIYHYQKLSPIILDLLGIMKFWMVICLIYKMYRALFDGILKKLYFISIVLSVVLFLLLLLDLNSGLFPRYEYRYGFPAIQLFFYHPTFLAANSVFLLIINTGAYFYNKSRISFIAVVMDVILVFFSLRMKAIGFLLMYIFFVAYILGKTEENAKLKLRYWIIIGIGIGIVAYDQIAFYLLDTTVARGALTATSIQILIDFFPIGTGFGTFGNSASGLYETYSPIYGIYNLSNIHGIHRSAPGYLSDVFWPAIIGQFGFIGIVLFIYMLAIIYKKISRVKDKYLYVMGMASLGYLLISSTSEAAFYASYSVLFAIIIAIVLAEGEK